MRRRLLKWLCSPCCRRSLSLRVIQEGKGFVAPPDRADPLCLSRRAESDREWCGEEAWSPEIVEGLLTCGCGRGYPISRGIPRFHQERFARTEAPLLQRPQRRAADLTAACYGSLWRFKARQIGWQVRSDEQTWFLSTIGVNAKDVA